VEVLTDNPFCRDGATTLIFVIKPSYLPLIFKGFVIQTGEIQINACRR
jgi:hypothetical protein